MVIADFGKQLRHISEHHPGHCERSASEAGLGNQSKQWARTAMDGFAALQ
jgi:hypothetical protein